MKYFFILLCAASLISCASDSGKEASETNNSEPRTQPVPPASAGVTKIQWIDSVNQVLSPIKKGGEVDILYRFRNVGDRPLVVESVTAGCGCTVAERPTEPIAPGAEGVIRGKFNSASQGLGTMIKNISVTANTEERNHQLTFNVTVVE